MTIEEKFNQILSILPDDGTDISVEGAPLCSENPWTDFTIRTLRKFRKGLNLWVLSYRTVANNLSGNVDIYSDYQPERYRRDVECLYNWLRGRGYFGYVDRNLF